MAAPVDSTSRSQEVKIATNPFELIGKAVVEAAVDFFEFVGDTAKDFQSITPSENHPLFRNLYRRFGDYGDVSAMSLSIFLFPRSPFPLACLRVRGNRSLLIYLRCIQN